jgi:hypothetical protein
MYITGLTDLSIQIIDFVMIGNVETEEILLINFI